MFGLFPICSKCSGINPITEYRISYDKRVKKKYLRFEDSGEQIHFFNDKDEIIGWLERLRVGRWMSWVYLLYEGCYLSAGCSDEVREKQRELNSKKK